MENNKLKIAYRLRFVPLIVSVVNLAIMLLLKYVFLIELGKILYYSVFFVLVAFVYMQAMRQKKREKEQADELALNPPPLPTKEEAQQIYENEMQGEINQQRSNIGFRIVYLSLGILVFLLSISLIVSNKEYLYGGLTLLFSIIFITHSIFVLRKWILYLRFFKEEKDLRRR